MVKNNLKDYEVKNIVSTLIVEGCNDTGIAGPVPGYLINRLKDVIEQIEDWQVKESKA